MKKFIVLLNRTETTTSDSKVTSRVHTVEIYADGFLFRSYRSVNKSADSTPGIEFYTLSPENKKVFIGNFFPLSRIIGVYDEQFTSSLFDQYSYSLSVCHSNYGIKGPTNLLPYVDILKIPAFWSFNSIYIVASSVSSDPIQFTIVSDYDLYAQCLYLANQTMQPNTYLKADIPANMNISTVERTVQIRSSNFGDYSLDFFFELSHS
jgi:hypothetical protein